MGWEFRKNIRVGRKRGSLERKSNGRGGGAGRLGRKCELDGERENCGEKENILKISIFRYQFERKLETCRIV